MVWEKIHILMNQIAPVDIGITGMQRIIVEMSGGKKINISVGLSDKEHLCSMMYGTLSEGAGHGEV